MIFTTTGWLGASIVWTHASGADTYTVSGDEHNALDVAVALRAWLDDAARPWAAAISTVTLTVGDDGARHRFLYAFTGSTPTFTSKTPNAAWIARFGDTSASPPTGCLGSCSAIPGTVVWDRWDTRPGERSRDGSWRFGHPLMSHRRPGVELEMTQAQAWALGQAVRLAAQPRSAYLYDEAAAVWRRVVVGAVPIEHPANDRTILVGTMEALGGDACLTAAVV